MSVRLYAINPPYLRTLGFTDRTAVKYIGPAQRSDGHIAKRAGRFPGYSAVRYPDGTVKNRRNDLLVMVDA